MVHHGDVDGDRQQRAQLAWVEPTVEQLHFLRLTAEHVDQADPRRVRVLEVGDLVGEHHRVVAPVAVQQRDGRVGMCGEYGAGDGQDGRDPAARGDQDMVPSYVEVGGEGSRRRLDVDHVPGPDLVHEPAGHRTPRHLADADARRAAPGRADRVGAALIATADRQGLPGGEGERVKQPDGDVEGHRGGVIGERVDAAHGQPMELGPGRNRAGHQISFTCSKGSRQAAQRKSALHAVALNAAVWVVSCEPHRGQGTGSRRVAVRVSGTGPRAGGRVRRRDAGRP